jgi:peptide/nickel transport system permease protein
MIEPTSSMESTDRATTDMPSTTSTESVYVTPNWKLVWWRFKKHRLALVSVIFLLAIMTVALFPEFFSTMDPYESRTQGSFMPPQRIHFFADGTVQPFVYAIEGKRNPTTLRMEWKADTTKKLPIRFFVKGYEYRVLGLFPADLHLIGLESEDGNADLFLLGTDRLGRDVWSRLIYGSRISLSIGLVGVALSLFLGILLGGISGYVGGVVDLVIQRTIELLQSLPTVPMWLALSAAVPRDWSPLQVYFAITVILSIVGWTSLGRQVRGRFLALKEEDFVVAARLLGCSRMRVIFHHMVPSMTSHIVAVTTLAIPGMILNETALSFLGLGLRPPVISWGVLLQEAQNIQSVALGPWLLTPGLLVILTVLAWNLVGDGLRDAADPYGH